MVGIIHVGHSPVGNCTCIAGREGRKLMQAESSGNTEKTHAAFFGVLAAADAFNQDGEGFDRATAFHFADGSGLILSYDGALN